MLQEEIDQFAVVIENMDTFLSAPVKMPDRDSKRKQKIWVITIKKQNLRDGHRVAH